MVNLHTRIPDCGSHCLALLDLFISSGASIYSTMAFPPLGNSDLVFVSVSIDFHLTQSRMACFIACLMTILPYDYLCADWVCLRDHLRDVPWEDIFSVSVAASKFC